MKFDKADCLHPIYNGVLDNTPELQSSTIRIFFNSSLSDMATEKNYLIKNCVPRLRKHFLERELDFQVVSWDETDKFSVDSAVQEIEFCKKSSRGPYFVIFLGDKYGSSFLPKHIDATEYRKLYRIAEKFEYDTFLLSQWYKRDDNIEPAVYYLQPITEVLTNYISNDQQKKTLKDQKEWLKVKEKLTKCLQTAANIAFQEGKITEKEHLKYFYSETEAEAICGIIESKVFKNRVLAYFRTFENVNFGDANTKVYTDIIEDTCRLDSERKELGERLKYGKIEKLVPADVMRRYTLYWLPVGVDPKCQDHKEYLEDLGHHFEESIIKMVKKTYRNNPENSKDNLYEEVLYHLHFAKEKLECFCDRNELLESIRDKLICCYDDQVVARDKNEVERSNQDETLENWTRDNNDEKLLNSKITVMQKLTFYKEKGVRYINGDTDCCTDRDLKILPVPSNDEFCQPVVLYGESGSGKSSLMAKVVDATKTWFPECITVVRFVGVTVGSCLLRDLIISIITQICRVTDKTVPSFEDLGQDIMSLTDLFKSHLHSICSSQRWFVIVDAVDQLTDDDKAHLMKWLPSKLPVNVHLIVSMSSKPHGCLMNTRSRGISEGQFIDIGYLDETTADKIITRISHCYNRRVVPPQRHQLLKLFANCQKPLYLKILTDQALQWRSTKDVTEFTVKPSIQSAIKVFFEDLEKKHGVVLVEKYFGYLMASREGLSWTEIEDILSLDDKTVLATSQYQLPTDIHHVRVESLALSKLIIQTSPYMILHKSSEKQVLKWRHRQFAEGARRRYLYNKEVHMLYQTLVDYFRGTWSNTWKPLEIILPSKRVVTYPSTNRAVPYQPLYYTDSVCNQRKLIELPFQLIKAKQFKDFSNDIACHFEWLFAKCMFVSVSSVIRDLRLALTEMDEEVVETDVLRTVDIVMTVISKGFEDISKDTTHLAVQILGQLGPSYKGYSGLEKLVRETGEWADNHTTPTLIPLTKTTPNSYCWGVIQTEINTSEDFKQNMHLDERRNCLLVLDPSMNSISTFDITSQGSVVVVEKPKRPFTTSIQCYDDLKLAVLGFDNGEGRHDCLVRCDNFSPVVLPEESQCITISDKYVIFSNDNKIIVCTSGENLSTMLLVYTVKLDEDDRIQHLVISPDKQYLLAFNKGGIYVLDNIPKLKLHHKVKVQTGSVTQYNHESLVHVLENNLLFYRGFKPDDEKNVHVVDLFSREEKYIINFSEEYSPTVFSVHPSRKYIGIGYSCKDMDPGSTTNSWYMYDTRDGLKLSKSPEEVCNHGISHLKLFGSDLIFAIDSPMFTASNNITIFYGGNVDNPLSVMLPFKCLTGHSQQITQLIISKDDSTLYTGAYDSSIRIWRLGRVIKDFYHNHLSSTQLKKDDIIKNYREQISTPPFTIGLRISRDCKLVYLGKSDGQFLVKDIVTGNTVHQQQMDQKMKFMLIRRTGGDIILIDSADVITVLDVNTYKARRKLKIGFEVTCAAEANGTLVVCRQENINHKPSRGKVFNIRNGTLIKEFEKFGSLNQVTLTSTGTKIVTDLKGFPMIIPVQKESKNDEYYLKIALESQDNTPSRSCAVGIRSDDKYAFSAATDGSLRVITMSGEFIMKCETKSTITTAMFSPDGKYIISAGLNTIYGWSVNQGVLSFKLRNHEDVVQDIKFNHSGRYMLSYARDNKLILWDILRKRSLASFVSHDSVSLIDLSDDAKHVAFCSKVVSDVAFLRLNKILTSMVEGKRRLPITPSMVDAQAMALSFSSQKMKQREATRIGCQVM